MEENFEELNSTIIKIAFYGPEITGKTTLTEQVANHFQANWLPDLSLDIFSKEQFKTGGPDFTGLKNYIEKSQQYNNGIVENQDFHFFDSGLLGAKVFGKIAYDFSDLSLEKAGISQPIDLFLLTDIDIPHVSENIEIKNSSREDIFRIYEQELILHNKPYLKITGNNENRLQKAITIIQEFQKALRCGFTALDFIQLYRYGISVDTAYHQWDVLKKGVAKTTLERSAKLEDGIKSLSEPQALFYADFFEEKSKKIRLKKFVPASGAATRMFKFLNEFLNDFKLGEESINAYINRKKDKNLSVFLIGKEKFSFYQQVLSKTKELYPEYDTWSRDLKDYAFIRTMLKAPDGFQFAQKPKGVLPFHQYDNYIATAVEEHLKECCFYAASNGTSNLHFTVSREHVDTFEQIIAVVKPKLERQFDTEISVNYSFQDSATDTLAIDQNGNLFRNEDQSLLFRPGGHGALIENLNSLDADIVFVKNIDNVIQNHIQVIALYKKALAGILLEIQEKTFAFLKELDRGLTDKNIIDEVVNFLNDCLQIALNEDFSKYTVEYKIEYLRTILNRPIRVCGMVKNEGEPGGGPFWVNDKKGNVFLQIVESSQVDHKDSLQTAIWQTATHFNPVDLVCGIKDYQGNKFDLKEFVNPASAFVVDKTKDGKALKSYELPGLWNGAMAKWLTVFVEVPLLTFNPVKTVNDLLKPAHQPQ